MATYGYYEAAIEAATTEEQLRDITEAAENDPELDVEDTMCVDTRALYRLMEIDGKALFPGHPGDSRE